jgi:hypothetical protein
MARRRRPTPTSGDNETPNTTLVIDEEDILLPSIEDQPPDDWPCYILENAVVYNEDGKTHANLLHAELNGPFTIRGSLKVPKQFRSRRGSSWAYI